MRCFNIRLQILTLILSELISVTDTDTDTESNLFDQIPSTPKFFAIQKKSCEALIFVKATKIFPALIQNLATLVWFLCNIHATPRGAHGSYKKKSAPQRIPVKISTVCILGAL